MVSFALSPRKSEMPCAVPIPLPGNELATLCLTFSSVITVYRREFSTDIQRMFDIRMKYKSSCSRRNLSDSRRII